MRDKSSKIKTVLIVSNCTWYLYNFRRELLNDLKNKKYNLILISPIDKLFKNFKVFYIKREFISYKKF